MSIKSTAERGRGESGRGAGEGCRGGVQGEGCRGGVQSLAYIIIATHMLLSIPMSAMKVKLSTIIDFILTYCTREGSNTA